VVFADRRESRYFPDQGGEGFQLLKGGIAMTNDDEIRAIWNKAATVFGLDPTLWRADSEGNWIYYFAYGDRGSPFGWEKHHVPSRALGGLDHIDDLYPLHWRANASKGGLLGAVLNQEPEPGIGLLSALAASEQASKPEFGGGLGALMGAAPVQTSTPDYRGIAGLLAAMPAKTSTPDYKGIAGLLARVPEQPVTPDYTGGIAAIFGSMAPGARARDTKEQIVNALLGLGDRR
jgi:hypothetical protein